MAKLAKHKAVTLEVEITEGGFFDFEAELTLISQQEPSVYIGLPLGTPNDTTADGLGIVDRGAVNEFGAPSVGVPSRPWLRSTFDDNVDAWSKRLQAAPFDKLADVLAALAEEATEATRERVKAWSDPPNAPLTVALKGFNDPLVETGAMAAAINRRWFYKPRGAPPRKARAATSADGGTVPTTVKARSGASLSSAAAWTKAAKRWAGAQAEFGFIAPTRSQSKKATRTLFTPKLKYKGRPSYKVPSKV
jgi:hypothetical protein